MAEMDIYMRRRLVALGGLVAFFIIFVLLVKSCGGDEEPEPVAATNTTGASGEAGAALTPEQFIEQADADLRAREPRRERARPGGHRRYAGRVPDHPG